MCYSFYFKLRYITSHPEAGITLGTDYVVHGNKLPQSKIRNSSLDRNQHEEGNLCFRTTARALLAHSIN